MGKVEVRFIPNMNVCWLWKWKQFRTSLNLSTETLKTADVASKTQQGKKSWSFSIARYLVKVNFKQDKPVDPTDQVMLRLKLLEALMDMSKFLLAFKKNEGKSHTNDDYD